MSNSNYRRINKEHKKAGSRRRFRNCAIGITLPERVVESIDALVPLMANDLMISAVYGRVTRSAVTRAAVILGLEVLQERLEGGTE